MWAYFPWMRWNSSNDGQMELWSRLGPLEPDYIVLTHMHPVSLQPREYRWLSQALFLLANEYFVSCTSFFAVYLYYCSAHLTVPIDHDGYYDYYVDLLCRSPSFSQCNQWWIYRLFWQWITKALFFPPLKITVVLWGLWQRDMKFHKCVNAS